MMKLGRSYIIGGEDDMVEVQRTVNPQVVGSSPTLPAIFLGFYEALWVNISFYSCYRDMLLASNADSIMVNTSS